MLNLDELLGEKKSIRWNGVDYPVEEITLRTVLKADKALQDAKDTRDVWQGMSQIVKEVVPGLDVDAVPVRALEKLFSYVVNGEDKQPPLAIVPEPETVTAEEKQTSQK